MLFVSFEIIAISFWRKVTRAKLQRLNFGSNSCQEIVYVRSLNFSSTKKQTPHSFSRFEERIYFQNLANVVVIYYLKITIT